MTMNSQFLVLYSLKIVAAKINFTFKSLFFLSCWSSVKLFGMMEAILFHCDLYIFEHRLCWL